MYCQHFYGRRVMLITIIFMVYFAQECVILAEEAEETLEIADVTEDYPDPGCGLDNPEECPGSPETQPPGTSEQPMIITEQTTPEPPCDPTDYDHLPLFKVTSILVPPYVMERMNTTGNITEADNHCWNMRGEYAGYLIDLLDKISEHMGKRYELQIVADTQYGKEDSGAWTGMIGEVVRGEAEVAAAPLTVTMEREKVVDFTHPFQVFETVAVILKRYPDDEQITSLQDMFENKFQFGVAKNSTIEKVLKYKSEVLQDQPYVNIWKNINSDQYVGFQDSNNHGVSKARWDRRFAFLMEGSTAEWVLEQEPCDLDFISTNLQRGQYAMAVPNQDHLRDQINEAMMELHHDGTMGDLKKRWWPHECSGFKEITSSTSGLALAIILVMLVVKIQ